MTTELVNSEHTKELQLPTELVEKVENQISAAELAALGEAERDLGGDIVGQPLKFAKGRWKKGFGRDDEQPMGNTTPLIADMRSYARGWIKWWDKMPVHKLIGRPIDNYPFPERRALPDQDKTKWQRDKSGTPQDPWQETHSIVMKDTEGEQGDDLCTYQTSSVGGRKALAKLINVYRRDVRKYPGFMPVVLLESRTVYSQDYGDIDTPVLKVVDWQPFGDGASAPGAPIESPPMIPAPEAKALPVVIDAESEPVVAGNGRDMDDEIPF